MGRRKKTEEEKVSYQRIGIRSSTYERLKQKVNDQKKIKSNFTLSDKIDSLMDQEEKNKA